MTAHDWRAALLRLDGAYSDNTIRTYRSDVQAYETWARARQLEPFPASAEMIAAWSRRGPLAGLEPRESARALSKVYRYGRPHRR